MIRLECNHRLTCSCRLLPCNNEKTQNQCPATCRGTVSLTYGIMRRAGQQRSTPGRKVSARGLDLGRRRATSAPTTNPRPQRQTSVRTFPTPEAASGTCLRQSACTSSTCEVGSDPQCPSGSKRAAAEPTGHSSQTPLTWTRRSMRPWDGTLQRSTETTSRSALEPNFHGKQTGSTPVERRELVVVDSKRPNAPRRAEES